MGVNMASEGESLVSHTFGRPSPLTALSLRTRLLEGIRQSQHTHCYDEQPITTRWELLGGSEPAFHYKSMEEPEQNILSSNQEPWIRLLKISPRLSVKTRYELITVQFDDHPLYTAISYAWGDPVNTKLISIKQDNRQGWLKIPANLSYALQAVQHKEEDTLVWVDSICINQQNNREKSQQLSQIPNIYGKAEQVLVWLGVEKDDSAHAHKLVHGLANEELRLDHDSELGSVVSLFDRDYWSRLWVVQEILHARDIVVQCGSLRLTWDDYTRASRLFQTKKGILAKIPSLVRSSYGSTRIITSQHRLSSLQILAYHGPASILRIQQARELYSDDSFFYLLHLLRISRTKLASDPKDRVYGILGILPDEVRAKFWVNYLLPVREIYVDVVEILLQSGNMDVMCESIHYPPQISNANLPSWVPDWSYDPMARSLASFPLSFSAASSESPSFKFHGDTFDFRTRSNLLIGGVRIGTIKNHGMAVNTHSRAADFCMAFLQWRVLLLQHFGIDYGSGNDESGEGRRRRVASCKHQRRFCLTLNLGQPIRTVERVELVAKKEELLRKTYCVFAQTIKARLPMLPIDEDLKAFAEIGDDDKEPKAARQFLQDSFAEYMMGRAFCITDFGSLGLGSGAMARGDVVVVPYGCSTPVLLRPEGFNSQSGYREYRFVGDAYIHGYMHGEAMPHGSREEFLLH